MLCIKEQICIKYIMAANGVGYTPTHVCTHTHTHTHIAQFVATFTNIEKKDIHASYYISI